MHWLESLGFIPGCLPCGLGTVCDGGDDLWDIRPPGNKEDIASQDLDVAILVERFTERKDLLKANVNIKSQGAAWEKYTKKSVKVIIMGNPANTNCPTASKSAPAIPKENFSCLTPLDHNPEKAQIALKLGVTADDVKNVIWRNHSSTQYPDISHANVKL
ncbi:Malate dehydrogenase, cytoplasmic [Tupaia chinensis]|uniref:Malate dehydrogenase, cytoplasmic n=1 Tax=Tupaia chinensis TaxID=246437 RepID=L9L9G5_TUPCH|nr:Malate dehydrogenase, cytoplasmic [Tupaia chinensis]